MPSPKLITDEQMIEVLEYKRKGMPNTHIAKIFGVSEAAIRKRLKKAALKKGGLKN